MEDQLIRTRMLFGASGMDKLRHATVAIFGVGGVGGAMQRKRWQEAGLVLWCL